MRSCRPWAWSTIISMAATFVRSAPGPDVTSSTPTSRFRLRDRSSRFHHRHRGGVPRGGPSDAGSRQGPTDRDVGFASGGARPPGGPRVPQGSDRGGHQGLRQAVRGAATTSPGSAETSQAWSRNTARRSSPPPPTPSPTGWSRRPTEQPRYQRIAADYQVVARQTGHLWDACPCRDRGRAPSNRPDEPGPLHAPAHLRPEHVVSVLGRNRHRASRLSPHHLQEHAPDRAARGIRVLGRVSANGQHPGRRRDHRGRHQAVVGHPALGPLSDARDEGQRRLHPARRRHDRGRLLSVPARISVPASPAQPEMACLLAVPDLGEHVAGAALRDRRFPHRLRSRRACPHSPTSSRRSSRCWPRTLSNST